jgi:MFS family permease
VSESRTARHGQSASVGEWRAIFTGRLGLYNLLLNLGTCLFAINQFVVSTLMPTVVTDLGGVRYYAWAFALFAVGAIIGAASSGPARDAFGDRGAFVAAAIALTLGLAGAAIANDMLVFVFWRFVQGLGGGALASQAYGLIAAMFPENLRGRVLSLLSTVWGVATLLGPGYGGVFAEYHVWREAFAGLVPLGLITSWLAWRYVPLSDSHGKLSRLPYLRLALLATSVFVLSLTSQTRETWMRIALVVASILLAAIAFHRDARAERGMFPKKVVTLTTEVGAAYWMMLLFSVVSTFVNVYAPLHLQRLHDMSPLIAGYLCAIPSFTWTFTAIAVATLQGPRQTFAISAGVSLIFVGATGLAFTVVPGPVWAIVLFMSILGFGIGAMNNPTIQRTIQAVPESEKHIAGTSVQTIRTLGISFGAAASGLIAVAAGLVTDDVPRDVLANAMGWVYGTNVIFGALTLLSLIPFLAGYRRRIAGQG